MKVLICADFSEAGNYVLVEAEKFLRNLKVAEVHVYSVIDVSVVSFSGLYENKEIMKTLEEDAEKVKAWAGEIFGAGKINFSSDVGQPGEMSWQKAISLSAELIILGTHGRSGINRLVAGSVAERVLHHTTCNILVIPVKHLTSD